MRWTISRTDAFVRQAARLVKRDPALRTPIARSIERLAENPAHPGLRVKRLQSLPGKWEARVNAAVRIVFSLDGNEIRLEAIGRHDDVLP